MVIIQPEKQKGSQHLGPAKFTFTWQEPQPYLDLSPWLQAQRECSVTFSACPETPSPLLRGCNDRASFTSSRAGALLGPSFGAEACARMRFQPGLQEGGFLNRYRFFLRDFSALPLPHIHLLTSPDTASLLTCSGYLTPCIEGSLTPIRHQTLVTLCPLSYPR